VGLVALLVAPTAGCAIVRGSGKVETETRGVSGFTKVELAGVGELRITSGDTEGLTVTADDNVLPFISTEVKGDTLVISLEDRGMPITLTSASDIVYRLSVRDLAGVKVSGSGTVRVDGLKTDDLEIEVSGSGTVQASRLDVTQLRYILSGSGKASMSGAAKNLSVDINGSGSLDAAELEATGAYVEINGSGRATVWVKDVLDARVSGSGDIRYYGTPRVNQDVSGSGNVRSLGGK
jgi:hypothetical protein